MKTSYLRLAALAVALCGIGGCENEDTLYPVEGKLLVSGIPAGDASIFFYPKNKAQVRIPFARTEPDGTFRLTTLRSGDGAPKGEYDVAVFWPDYSIPRDECADPLHDRLQLRYSDPAKTELHATIRPGKNEVNLHTHIVGGGGWSFPRLRDIQK